MVTAYYPENYFSHVILNKGHRSVSGKWSPALTRNPKAVQVGLTARPRRLEFAEQSREAQADAQGTSASRSMSTTSDEELRMGTRQRARFSGAA